jgi:hypothetical protein
MLHRISERPVGFEHAPGQDTLSMSRSVYRSLDLLLDWLPNWNRFMGRLSSWTTQPEACEASATQVAEPTTPRTVIGEFSPKRVIRLARRPASRAATCPHTCSKVSIIKATSRSIMRDGQGIEGPNHPVSTPHAGRSCCMSEIGRQNIGRATYPAPSAQSRPDICTTVIRALPKRRPRSVRSFARGLAPDFTPVH